MINSDIIGQMLSTEAGSITENYSHLQQRMRRLAREPQPETKSQNTLGSCLDLVGLGIKSYLFHLRAKKIITEDSSLPEIVRNDPPSLRSILWMIMIDEALNPSSGLVPRAPAEYPLRLFALTRAYLNGMDDVMDSGNPPISKKQLNQNRGLSIIHSALAREFIAISREDEISHKRVRKSLRGYLLIRNNWISQYNDVEQDRDQLSFDEALEYTITTMGPMTFILNYAVAVNHDLSELQEERLNEALVWYGAAGKLIDDLTDWFKDNRRGELNLFCLALRESDELDRVIKLTRFFEVFGERAFVPISLFHLIAPKATGRVLSLVDSYIEKIRGCGYEKLASSMNGIRHMMWVYALNEGLPQV